MAPSVLSLFINPRKKLNYLLKKAKKNGVMIDMIKEIEIRKKQYNEEIEAG